MDEAPYIEIEEMTYKTMHYWWIVVHTTPQITTMRAFTDKHKGIAWAMNLLLEGENATL